MNPPGRDEVVAFAANGNPYAQAFLTDFYALCDIADDIEDEAPEHGRAEKLLHRMVDICANPFFRVNADALSSHIRAMVISWAASNSFVGPNEVRQKYTGSPWQLLGYVAFLCGGADRARDVVSQWITKYEVHHGMA